MYEKVDIEALEAFKFLIESSCQKYNIKAIAEEFSENDLKKDRTQSFVKEIASDLKLPHMYCNPSEEESGQLGFRPFLIKKRGESKSDFIKRDFKNEILIEKAWLDKIINFNIWPLLFVCDSMHIESFKQLLTSELISVSVLYENWVNKE